MRKFKYLIFIALICSFSMLHFSGCANIAYEKLELQYSSNVFALGEDYYSSALIVYGVTPDGYKRDITAEVTIDSSNYNKDKEGGYSIFVTYMNMVAEYIVYVGEDPVTSIEVSDSKTQYEEGEEYTSAGLKVYAVRVSGKRTQVTDNIIVDSSRFSSTIGKYTIIVKYGELTAEYKVEVTGVSAGEILKSK